MNGRRAVHDPQPDTMSADSPNDASALTTSLGVAVLAATSDAIWLVGSDGRTLWHNPALLEMLGTTPEELAHRRFSELSLDGSAATPFAACQAQNSEQRFDAYFVRGDDTWGCADTRLIPHPGIAGSVLVVMKDISQNRATEAALRTAITELERRIGLDDVDGLHAQTAAVDVAKVRSSARYEQELSLQREHLMKLTKQVADANRELEAFSYSVSHDLREPLRSIDGFSRILLERYASSLDERGKDHLRRVRLAAQRMGELITNMLVLARVNRAPLVARTVDVTVVAREILTALAASDRDRKVEVIVADDLNVEADPRLLRTVLENLLENAWKFTSATAHATIEVTRCASESTSGFCIADNGAGFDMKYAGKLFRPFQRLHSQEDFPGTGVGLATVQRIVARHGGSVHADATCSAGANFFVTFPRVKVEAAT